MPRRPDIAVVGAGVIGLAVAWRAAQSGATVVVHERGDEPGKETSSAAAGMLAPVSEADPQEPALLALALASTDRWPSFAAELEQLTGIDVGYRELGTLFVARDDDEAAWLERELALRAGLALAAEPLLGSAARGIEPALTPSLRRGALVPGDRSVDPRAVVAALESACRAEGVEIVTGDEVTDPAAVDGGHVVVAAGPWCSLLDARVPVRPLKGQALLLRDPAGPGLCEHVLRWGVPSPGYLVPRAGGIYYLGATAEEKGFDRSMTAVAVHELLRDSSELLPGILELEIVEAICGLRPATPDNLPLIGRAGEDSRVTWATGHFRHGFLLCPLTAELVVADVLEKGVPQGLATGTLARLGPGRFEEVMG